MTDDTGTDSPADDPRIDAISRAARQFYAPPLDAAAFVRAARARRRRNRTIISSVLAAVVIVAGVSVATTAGSSSPSQNNTVDAADQSDSPDTQPFPDPPAGSKWVGVNGVVVAIPSKWSVTDEPCGTGEPDEIVLGVAISKVRCTGPVGGNTRVTIAAFDGAGPESDDSVLCDEGVPTICYGSTRLEVERVVINLSVQGDAAPARVERILETAMVLPDGWTTVPVGGEDMMSTRAALLGDAGFKVGVPTGTPGLADGPVTSTPESGSPVREGATITLEPLSQDPDTQGITAVVTDVRPDDDLARQDLNTAVWNADRRTVVYRGEWPDDACGGTAEASTSDTSVQVALMVQRDGFCDPNTMAITISGFTEAPTELVITSGDETRTVPVEQEQDPEAQELTVTVVNARDFDRGDLPEGQAVWDAQSQTVVYLPFNSYDACLTQGVASARASAVNLTLARYPEGCGESLNAAVVKISGLTEAPSELVVTEDGETRTVPVE